MPHDSVALGGAGARLQVTPAPLRLLLTVEEAAVALGLGRTHTYSLVMREQILSVKVGRMRRIPVFALEEFVARQVTQQKGA